MTFGARMVRLLCLLVALAAMLTVVACGSDDDDSSGSGSSSDSGSSSEPVKFTVGAWGGAIDAETKKTYTDPYSSETGDSFVFDGAPATQLAKLKAQDQAGNVTWDLLDSVGADNAWPAFTAGLLEPLPADLKTKLEDTLGAGKVSDFGITHANIAHVIACNMDKVDKCPKTMAEFFDVEQFPGSRMFPGIGPLTAAAMAQSALGVPKDQIENDPPDVDAVFDKLNEVKPEIKVFFTSGDQQLQIMRGGEADMGIMWSGRAYALKADGMNMEINWDGGVYEPSYWAVTAGSKNKEQGFKFIEWLANNVEGQATWAKDLHYSVPNPKALETLPQEIQDELADTPSNFEKIVTPNYRWYADNADSLNKQFEDFVKG
jgi:putative spermidine/putrescine transport system substrate-binding protein